MGSGSLKLFDRRSAYFSAKERDTTSAGIHGFFFNSCKTVGTSIKSKATQVNYDMPWQGLLAMAPFWASFLPVISNFYVTTFLEKAVRTWKRLCGLSLLLDVALLRRFFFGFSGFPPSRKPNISQIARIEDPHESQLRLMCFLSKYPN